MASARSEEKKKLANEKRLSSLRKWKKQLSSKHLTTDASFNELDIVKPNKRIVYGDDEKDEPAKVDKNMPALFSSSSDSEEEDQTTRFRVRPQFEGQTGQKHLEMSSEFSGRFKLDDRFKDDPTKMDEGELTGSDEDPDEKSRNIKILEQVLQCQIPRREVVAKNKLPKGKRFVRFDPESDNVDECIRQTEPKKEQPKGKSERESVEGAESTMEDIPVSAERYYEVSSDLKEILATSSTPFTLSQKFETDLEMKNIEADRPFHDEKAPPAEVFAKELATEVRPKKMEKFFIKADDPRLKEGAEFFMRPRPMDQLREEWFRNREHLLGLLKRRKVLSLKKPQTPRANHFKPTSVKRKHT